jgi:hypothetical protein
MFLRIISPSLSGLKIKPNKKQAEVGSEFEIRWGQYFSSLHVLQAGSRIHPAS